MKEGIGVNKSLKLLLAAVLAGIVLWACPNEKGYAGDIFTRDATTITYPATRRIAVKTPMLNENIRYFSSDKSVALVDKDGTVMSMGVGSCTILAEAPDGTRDEYLLTVEEVGTPHKQIALTFDDGPGVYGQQLMDYLAEKGVHVTFFYIGNQVAEYADNVYRAYNDGHEIGNHSYTHPVMSTLSTDGQLSELAKCHDAIVAACGAEPTLFRPPYGSKNDRLLSNCGLPCILWSVDTLDWKNRDSDYVSRQIINSAADGHIMLVHEIHKTTIAGVKIAIDRLLEDGWEFVTVSELWERDGYQMEPGVVYGRKK